MSAADEPLPRIGHLSVALEALDVVELAHTQRRRDGAAREAAERGELPELGELVITLANIAAILLQFIEVTSKHAGSGVSGLRLLEVIRRDQLVHEARDDLSRLDDDGIQPWPETP